MFKRFMLDSCDYDIASYCMLPSLAMVSLEYDEVWSLICLEAHTVRLMLLCYTCK